VLLFVRISLPVFFDSFHECVGYSAVWPGVLDMVLSAERKDHTGIKQAIEI
jgi:hypothetical protein